MKKLISLLAVSSVLLFACGDASNSVEQSELTNTERIILEEHGDQEVSDFEQLYLTDLLANFVENSEEVYLEEHEAVEIQESPNSRKDSEGNVYDSIYIVEIEFKLDGDSTKHGARSTMAFETNGEDEATALVYGSSLNKYKANIETEFIEE